MIKKSILLSAALAVSHFTFADVVNGEFEDWTGGSPDAWTTIDSGINVTQTSSVIQNGTSAAAITVNTGTQGSTDFRQTVNVVAGQTISFSTWIYHTEGNVKARLYVDGYRNYSSASLTNQWQQISFDYTPASSGSIEVGLRFYDQTGFDGSEIVYVDNFQPNSGAGTGGGSGGTGGGSGGTCTAGSFDLVTDSYGYETSWEITDSSATIAASGSGYGNSSSYSESVCLEDGNYTLTVSDSYGDGMCCSYGSGSYSLTLDGQTVASGGSFTSQDVTSFTVGGTTTPPPPPPTGYYAGTDGLSGFALKTALYNIIKGHSSQGYGALWSFYSSYELDSYYENDGSILDIYSERPASNDPYVYAAVSDQCGTYSGEGNCYNREHSFPRSWFGGSVEPMNSDVHHIFPSDGYVNSKRSSYPYGEVGSATYTSSNGSKLGSAVTGLGYSGTVFEPIDEFKGDLARAYFYMATRYENVISGWQNNSASVDAVLNGTSSSVFEPWFLAMLKSWHNADPVSPKEINRNDAAHSHQGNRNPYVDHPEFVSAIWGN